MPSISLRIRYRPARIGWCVESGNWEQLQTAFRLSTTLAGGLFNPVIPVDQPELAEALVDRFQLDLLYPIGNTERTEAFSKDHPYLIWPDFGRPELFAERWQHIPAHGKFLDVYHAARRLSEHRTRDRKMAHVRWEPDDPLSTVLLATYGDYPEASDSVPDYAAVVRQFARLETVSVELGQQLPTLSQRLTPIALTCDGLEWLERGPLPGIYAGECDCFDDVVNFWNLRAAGSDLVFVDERYQSRFQDQLDSHKKWLSTLDLRPWDRDGSITVYGRDMRDNPRDTSFLHDRVIRHEVGDANWNGLNIRPIKVHWEDQPVLGSVEESDRIPTLSFSLPRKPAVNEVPVSGQWLVATVLGNDHWRTGSDATFFPPFIPELNEYYARQLYHRFSHVRAEPPDIWPAVSLIVEVSTSDLTLRAIAGPDLIQRVLDCFGLTATPSEAGRVTTRLVAQMGGVQSCRVFKIGGVRNLIEKYSPDESFTRSAAVQVIRDVDPKTNAVGFDAFRDLYISSRPRGKSLSPHDVLDYLLRKHVFRVGLELKCPHCELRSWESLDDVGTTVECPYCGASHRVATQLKDRDWAFRRSGLFGRNDHQLGGIPVALTLQQLQANLHPDSWLSSSSLLIEPKPGIPARSCETDFILVTTGYSHHYQGLPQVVLGECKTRKKITEEDARNLAMIADALPTRRLNTFVLFSKLSAFEPDEIAACAHAQSKWRSRVILLSKADLEPYFVPEVPEGQRMARAHGLEGLAERTSSIYPELRPTGFDDLDRARIAPKGA